jgi:hypothetical protein
LACRDEHVARAQPRDAFEKRGVLQDRRAGRDRAERLSKDYRANLYKNDLITTTTFQDLQAGGKMIVGAVIGLELINNKSKDVLTVETSAA